MKKYLLALILILFASLSSGGTAMAGQLWSLPPLCQKGGDEAEELFNMALNYQYGVRGMPFNAAKAMKLYEESVELGNPKAAINLGTMWRTQFAGEQDTRVDRLQKMNELYQKAIDLGCPEGYYFLSYSYAEGYGVDRDVAMSDALIKKGVAVGSVICLSEYGIMLYNEGKREEGLTLMEQALDRGFFPAALELGVNYKVHYQDYEAMIRVYRKGASLGSRDCLYCLFATYVYGEKYAGQPIDREYAECFRTLFRQINEKEPPRPIDLDKLCPPRPVKPHPSKQ